MYVKHVLQPLAVQIMYSMSCYVLFLCVSCKRALIKSTLKMLIKFVMVYVFKVWGQFCVNLFHLRNFYFIL